MRVEIEPGSKVHGFYGSEEAEEEYRCNFGLDPEHRQLIEEGGLRVSGVDETGEARILELPDHDFYVATLFVPQMCSSPEDPHPLIVAFIRTALGARREKKRPDSRSCKGEGAVGLPLEQTVTAVPLLQGFFRILGEVLFALVCGDLAPWGGVVQHETDALARSGE